MNDVFGKQQGPRSGPLTKETLSSELLTENNLDTKTDIKNPLALTILDVMSVLYSRKEVRNEMLKKISLKHDSNARMIDIVAGLAMGLAAYRFRVNCIPFRRQSRREFLEAIVPGEFESERRSRLLERLYVGRME